MSNDRNRLVSFAGSLVCLFALCACAAGEVKIPAPLTPAVAKQKKIPSFYKQYIMVGDLPIVSSDKVSKAALVEAARLTEKMLAGRPDILKAMVQRNGRIMVVGVKEGITDLPEYGWLKPKVFWDMRSRGFGGGHGKVNTSCAEENLLCLPDDLYEEECIFIHEFAHTIHETINLGDKDKKFDKKLKKLHKQAIAKGLWSCSYKPMYAVVNEREYWAEGVQSWFDCNNQNNFKHNHIDTREELKAYDPDLAGLIDETLRLTEKTDWRYKAPRKRPYVTAPGESLKCDPFYKKHVRARDFAILSSDKVSDVALLEANRIVRHMFAYRHDILKDMIQADLRLVVLGEKEEISDIPELKRKKTPRSGDKAPPIVCSQKNLLNEKGDQSVLIRELARAIHVVCGLRPVDEKLAKALEAYEKDKKASARIFRCQLGVKPIDLRFDEKLKQLHTSALAKGLWKDTLAGAGHVDYWVEGVQSWFDANAQGTDGHNKVNTRKELEAYDPDLAKFIAEVFLHTQRVDWRYEPSKRRQEQ
ncbi:MAG: hypothetical protein QGH60_13600 [Phycisphaerae bacterium]|nr:hypothetical protein [Phycisphaerae bacterium]